MKPIYGHIKAVTGQLTTGICALQIIPREWLTDPLVIDFASNIILVEPVLTVGKAWIDLLLVEPSFAFSEKHVSSKGGSYYEVSISGSLNNTDAGILQTLETLRYHEFICILKDKQGRTKIVGDTDAGLTLQITTTQTNDQGGTEAVALVLFMLSETASPFYIEP